MITTKISKEDSDRITKLVNRLNELAKEADRVVRDLYLTTYPKFEVETSENEDK